MEVVKGLHFLRFGIDQGHALEFSFDHIRDRRADALCVFAPLNEAQRAGLVTDAWSVGLRALTNAYKQAEESRLSDIGRTLKEDVEKQRRRSTNPSMR